MTAHHAKMPRHGSYEHWLLTSIAMFEAAKRSEEARRVAQDHGRALYAAVYCPGFGEHAPVCEPDHVEPIGDENVTAGYTIQF